MIFASAAADTHQKAVKFVPYVRPAKSSVSGISL